MRRHHWCGLLLSACILPAQAAGFLETLLSRTTATVGTLAGGTTEALDPLLVGATQLTPPYLDHVVIRLQGNNLVLAAGTAAFDATFQHNGRTRRFVVVRPEPAAAGAPVLLLFHGNGGTAENQANLTEVADLVAAEGVWAVMPASVDGVWDDDPARPKGYDDVGFAAAVIAQLQANFSIDPQRVYAAGLSNGSFMTMRLACELSDRIAGFGIVAGSLTGGLESACAPVSPRPLMLVAGSRDPIVPYNGGRIGVRSVPQAFSFWLGRNGCNPAQTLSSALPDIANDGTTVALQANSSCSSGSEVRLYTVTGGGHAWPGGWQYLPVPLIGTTSQDMDATQEIWDFLRDAHL
ncbi:alpha/beta hydrolase family esterase [Solimonas fluminis]|uniref:alpha/beta hydrolase family esterase n=1 Tax=Solimonas fluminis TaxID=2086571 RepID=UPI001FAF6CBB|nr:PHB depolymerase family esterase [Solimonas fluminis]